MPRALVELEAESFKMKHENLLVRSIKISDPKNNDMNNYIYLSFGVSVMLRLAFYNIIKVRFCLYFDLDSKTWSLYWKLKLRAT